jgi:Ca-activated chloride channel homolog
LCAKLRMICELALILAIDVSGSVSAANYVLQRDATADALEQVMRPNPVAPMAVQVIMWENYPHVVIPWTLIRYPSQVSQLAHRLKSVDRPGMGATNLTSLMRDALDQFDHVPCESERLILDVSGDGTSDEPDLDQQRMRAEHMNVQVNGLPIVTDLQPYDIVSYFRTEVVTLDGFVVSSNNWDDYYRAIRGKLALEVSTLYP